MVPMQFRSTSDDYSPHDLLPAPVPKDTIYPTRFFYENVVKHLVKDTVRIMMNGLHIDLAKVQALEEVLNTQLDLVASNLLANPLIYEFQKLQHKRMIEEYCEDRRSKLRPLDRFLKPFNYKDITHRSYFVYLFTTKLGLPQPSELLPTGVPKWDARLVKKLSANYPVLRRLLEGKLPLDNPLVEEAMFLLAQHKQDIYNRSYLEQIGNPEVDLPPFNPASSLQKQQLFEWLGIESEEISKKTGKPVWDRDQIERINRTTADPAIRDFTQQFIDYSFAAIVRNNFIEAFYKYTVNGRLHGQLNLFGAKSFRYTSQSPNLLNAPSSGSIFAKPIKECFTAQEGRIIATIDYSALEQRVLANLAHEETLIKMYQNDLDGHCVGALYYFPELVAQHMTVTGDLVTDAREMFRLVDEEKHSELKKIRSDGKPVSFGLQYGAYPPKVAASIKCTLETAEKIFDAYHNQLYPSVTKFREEYVLPFATEHGYLHLGLGCIINTDDPRRDIRTITNASSQFWSILTILTINKLHQKIDAAGYQDRILVTSTIYDSIYFEMDKDVELIKWLNDTLVPIMKQPFIKGQVVENLADLEIGNSWAKVFKIENNASLSDIQTVLEKLSD